MSEHPEVDCIFMTGSWQLQNVYVSLLPEAILTNSFHPLMVTSYLCTKTQQENSFKTVSEPLYILS